MRCMHAQDPLRWMPFMLLVAGLSCLGCTDQEAGIVTDMHHDFDHEHEHQHSDDDSHEHGHDDGFHGSHSHEHTHGHRHDEPLYGGRIVSIGHTHHKGGATHFHAEVMPLSDDTVRLHVLTDSTDGGLERCPVEVKEFTALVSVTGQESAASELTFVAGDDSQQVSASVFHMEIPSAIADAEEYSIVIPKLKLGGHRQNFSFRVSRPSTEETSAEETSADDDDSGAATDE